MDLSPFPFPFGVTDDYDNKSSTSVILNGSPADGMTIDYSQDMSVEDKGGDSNTDTIDSPSSGNDSETDVFSSHDDITETGGGHSNVSLTYNSDDGSGNTVKFSETDNEGDSIDESLHNVDGGEEDIGVANGQETSDTRDETDTETGGGTITDDLSSIVSLVAGTVDPTTGLRTTFSFSDTHTDDLTEGESLGATDKHTGGSMSPDQVSGDDNVTEEDDISDTQQQSIGLVGTDASGNTYNLTETSSSNVTEKITAGDDVSEAADGTTTETSGDQITVDEQDTESLSGTMSSVDPMTGVTTSITLNDTLGNTLHDAETDGDTHVTPPPMSANPTQTDTPTMTEGGTDTQRLQLNETVTRTNADGTPFTGSTDSTQPQSVHTDLTDTETSTNGVVTDQGVVNTPPPSPTTEAASGGNGSETPNVESPQNSPPTPPPAGAPPGPASGATPATPEDYAALSSHFAAENARIAEIADKFPGWSVQGPQSFNLRTRSLNSTDPQRIDLFPPNPEDLTTVVIFTNPNTGSQEYVDFSTGQTVQWVSGPNELRIGVPKPTWLDGYNEEAERFQRFQAAMVPLSIGSAASGARAAVRPNRGSGGAGRGGNAAPSNATAATRRTQSVGDLDFASQSAARREAMRRYDIQTSKSNNFKMEVDPKSYKNSNLRGPNGEPSEILKAKDLNGNDVEIKHHKWGHQFNDNNTFELPHFNGPNGEHLTYPR